MPRLGASPGSPLFPGWAVKAFYWALHAPGGWLARRGVSPDALTLGSLGISLTSLPLAATGHLGAAGLAVLLGATLDALDGMVARALGQASDAGAVLDSVADRAADAAPLVGLALFYRGQVWGLGIVLGALFVSGLLSYVRAKSEIYGLRLPNGLMRRHERVAYLGLSLLLAPWQPGSELWSEVSAPLALVGPAVIASVGLVASLQLLSRTRAALRGSAYTRAAR